MSLTILLNFSRSDTIVSALKVSEVIILFLAFCLSHLSSAFAACSPPQFDQPHYVGSINTTKITEASGIAVSRANPGVLYTHNDGTSGKIYAISTDAQLLATFDPGKNVDDTEDIAVGPGPNPGTSYIYLGDIGSNTESRDKVRVLQIPEPTVDLSWAQDPVSRNLGNAEVFTLVYPDGKYNAETLMIDGNLGELFIATKQTGLARIYRARLNALSAAQDNPLEFIGEISFSIASGGDISADGRYIAIRNESFALLWVKQPNQSAAEALFGEYTGLPLVGKPGEPNGEAIAFAPDSSGYYTISEGGGQPLFFFPRLFAGNDGVPQFTASPRRTAEGWRFDVTGCPGTTVSLLKSTDLRGWQIVSAHQLTSEQDAFVDPDQSTESFYRLEASQ